MSEPITNLEDAVAALGALPMPAGPVPQPSELDRVHDLLTGANLSLYEEELESARLRLALASAQRGRRELRAEVAALREERHSTNESLSLAAENLRENRDRIVELEAQRERRRMRLVELQNDALNMRGSLSPNGEDRKVPFLLGETLAPAVDWLIARVAELEALTPARHQTCRVCGAGYTFGEPCAQCEFRARMAAELQARGLDGEHYVAVHHDYRNGRDLPGLGGQR